MNHRSTFDLSGLLFTSHARPVFSLSMCNSICCRSDTRFNLPFQFAVWLFGVAGRHPSVFSSQAYVLEGGVSVFRSFDHIITKRHPSPMRLIEYNLVPNYTTKFPCSREQCTNWSYPYYHATRIFQHTRRLALDTDQASICFELEVTPLKPSMVKSSG